MHLSRCLASILVLALLAIQPISANASTDVDPAGYLLSEEDLPSGFEPQPQRDREVEEPDLGVTRAFRLYTRGAPDVPTENHASIMLSAAVGDSAEHANTDFADTAAAWQRMGYPLTPIDGVGDEALAGEQMLFPGTDHPKQAAFVLFRVGDVTAAVQWTDQPAEVTVAHAIAIAQLMERRIAA